MKISEDRRGWLLYQNLGAHMQFDGSQCKIYKLIALDIWGPIVHDNSNIDADVKII